MSEVTVLATTLQRLAKQRPGFVQALSLATGIDDSTIYKWLSGQTEPGFTRVALVFRHCGDDEVQRGLLGVLSQGTRWEHFLADLSDLDANGDGQVSLDDALDLALVTGEMLMRHMRSLRHRQRDRAMNDQDRDALAAEIAELIQHLCTVRAIVDHLHTQAAKRRPAKPPRSAPLHLASGGGGGGGGGDA